MPLIHLPFSTFWVKMLSLTILSECDPGCMLMCGFKFDLYMIVTFRQYTSALKDDGAAASIIH